MNRFSATKIGILAIVVFLIFFFVPVAANAQTNDQGLVPCGGPSQPACQLCHLFQMFGTIINTIVWRIVPAIATILIIVAGIKFLTALGNPSELKKIKDMFIGIFAGFLLVVLAWSVTVALYTAMGAGTPTGWWQIPGCP